MIIKQEPVFLRLDSDFPQNIMNLVKEHKIKMVYWDLGGTLVDLSLAMKERAVKKINETYHREISLELYDWAMKNEWMCRETPEAQKEIKSVDNKIKEKQYWIDFYTCVLRNLEIRVRDRRVVKWLATVQSNPKSFEELPFVRATLSKLKEMNISAGIISNAFPSARGILERSDLIQEFNEQHVILSYEYNSIKPERTIYQEAINQAKVKPQEILFIDDRRSFADGAARKGMKAVVVSDAKGQDFSGSGKSEVTTNEYSATSLMTVARLFRSSLLKGIQVCVAHFKTGFLCSPRKQGSTKSLSPHREMWRLNVRSPLA